MQSISLSLFHQLSREQVHVIPFTVTFSPFLMIVPKGVLQFFPDWDRFNPLTAMLAASSLGKRPMKNQIKNHQGLFPRFP